jgi:hypothetical protein
MRIKRINRGMREEDDEIMPKEIGDLLNQKSWTGEEVGKALLASLINDVKNKGKTYDALFSQSDFEKMERTLTSPKDLAAYGVYQEIYTAVVAGFNKGQGLAQQFHNGYHRYAMNAEMAYNMEKALADMELQPLIMTRSQYERAREQARAEKRDEKGDKKRGEAPPEATDDEIIAWYLQSKGDRLGNSRKGIAILTAAEDSNTDEQGDYLEEKNPLSGFPSIGDIAGNEAKRKELAFCIHALMKPALRYLCAYNALIDIISKAYAIGEAECLKQNLAPFEGELDRMSGRLAAFHDAVYGDPGEKSKKQAFIREIFEPVSMEEAKPRPEAAERISAEITQLGFTPEAKKKLKNFEDYVDILMGVRV